MRKLLAILTAILVLSLAAGCSNDKEKGMNRDKDKPAPGKRQSRDRERAGKVFAPSPLAHGRGSAVALLLTYPSRAGPHRPVEAPVGRRARGPAPGRWRPAGRRRLVIQQPFARQARIRMQPAQQ